MVLPPGALGAGVAGPQRVVRVVRRTLRVRELNHVEQRERVHKPKQRHVARICSKEYTHKKLQIVPHAANFYLIIYE
jgi:hypothetical protein